MDTAPDSGSNLVFNEDSVRTASCQSTNKQGECEKRILDNGRGKGQESHLRRVRKTTQTTVAQARSGGCRNIGGCDKAGRAGWILLQGSKLRFFPNCNLGVNSFNFPWAWNYLSLQ